MRPSLLAVLLACAPLCTLLPAQQRKLGPRSFFPKEYVGEAYVNLKALQETDLWEEVERNLVAAGSPGARWMIVNTTTPTISIVGITASIRFAIYRCISPLPPPPPVYIGRSHISTIWSGRGEIAVAHAHPITNTISRPSYDPESLGGGDRGSPR